jgi:dCTP deaminase
MPKRFNAPDGALPLQFITKLCDSRSVVGALPQNIKPSSLDLSISAEVYEVEGIFLPQKGESVRDVLKNIKKKKHPISKALTPNTQYIIALRESLALPENVYAFCNPKSTTGRIDTHVRMVADGVARFDTAPAGFAGELWIYVVPYTFPILLHEGMSLNQLRFFTADTRLTDTELQKSFKKEKLLWLPNGTRPYEFEELYFRDHDSSIILTLDLKSQVLGYEGIKTSRALDLSKIAHYTSRQFFKPIEMKREYLYLRKNHFYILSTFEAVRVPPHLACEMLPVDERSGDFRSHYAGFIDPGWGWGMAGEGKGRQITLEVRPFEDLIVRHQQPIGKIKFEKMAAVPEAVYDAVSSNYTAQKGPKLAKHFK